MRITQIKISIDVEQKIYVQHGVSRKELEEALWEGSPIFFRAKGERYLALTKRPRYLTVIFIFGQGSADLITAYPSSEWQIKLYQRKRG